MQVQYVEIYYLQNRWINNKLMMHDECIITYQIVFLINNLNSWKLLFYHNIFTLYDTGSTIQLSKSQSVYYYLI